MVAAGGIDQNRIAGAVFPRHGDVIGSAEFPHRFPRSDAGAFRNACQQPGRDARGTLVDVAARVEFGDIGQA